jgi:hypothetical protein
MCGLNHPFLDFKDTVVGAKQTNRRAQQKAEVEKVGSLATNCWPWSARYQQTRA